jgi:hypothetical protein
MKNNFFKTLFVSILLILCIGCGGSSSNSSSNNNDVEPLKAPNKLDIVGSE